MPYCMGTLVCFYFMKHEVRFQLHFFSFSILVLEKSYVYKMVPGVGISNRSMWPSQILPAQHNCFHFIGHAADFWLHFECHPIFFEKKKKAKRIQGESLKKKFLASVSCQIIVSMMTLLILFIEISLAVSLVCIEDMKWLTWFKKCNNLYR